jgi:hypothetical protein
MLLMMALLLQDKLVEDNLSKIDQQMAAAKSLSVEVRVDIRIQFADHEEKTTLSGKLLLRDSGKARVDLVRVRDNQESSTTIISNGTTITDTREEETREIPTPKDYNKNFILAALGPTGVTKAYTTTFNASEPADYDVRKKFTVSKIRAEPDEGELKSLSYTLAFGEHASLVRIWYSPTQLRPLKRELVWKTPNATVTSTEVYQKYVVDAEITDDKFELPAKK